MEILFLFLHCGFLAISFGNFLFAMKGELTDLSVLRNLLKKYHLWAKKRLGQNFLINKNVLRSLIETASLQETDTVVEVGPGPGVLTRELLPLVKKVIAVEIDGDIIPALIETTHFYRDKIEILNTHILGISLPESEYKVVANIPYHLTSPLLRKFLVETESRPHTLTLLVQKEVAEKICNTKKKSLLSLFVEVFGKAEIICIVPPDAFFPPPKVSSALLHIIVSDVPKITLSPKCFFQVVKMGFSQRRKKLKNNLPQEILKKAGVDENLRAENLCISDWEKIAKEIYMDAPYLTTHV